MKETGLKLKNRSGSGGTAALWRGLLMAALLLLFVTGLSGCGKREVVLEFAMFNGSNWDVAIQDSYPPIDEAIRKLGIVVSTKALYEKLLDYCNPEQFMEPYNFDAIKGPAVTNGKAAAQAGNHAAKKSAQEQIFSRQRRNHGYIHGQHVCD